MDARDTWQALQARLTAARAAVDAGDRERALAEINAALAIDPDFLAAHSLRDRILAPADADSATLPPSRPDASWGIGEPRRSSHAGYASGGGKGSPCTADATPTRTTPPAGPATGAALGGRPIVSADGYAKFEQRAKRRRVDRRLDAARAALASGRLKAAATALDEVIELDPNLPDLTALTAQFDDLRRTAAAARRGPRLVAAAVFVVTVLGASWLRDSSELISRPMIAAAPLVAPLTPTVAVSSEMIAVGTAGERVPLTPDVDATSASDAPGVAVAMPMPAPADASAIAPHALPAPPDVPATAPAQVVGPSAHESPAMAARNVPALPPASGLVDDQVLVTQTLQRYRPAARAFDGLESQTLTFDACDVRVRGEAATATCRGSARDVPKVGSREPRVEPRTWNFMLRKDGADWKIDHARAER